MSDTRTNQGTSPVPSSPSSSKLPKFLQKQAHRERSGSRNEPISSPGSNNPISAASSLPPPPRKSTTKFLNTTTKDRKIPEPDPVDDPPVIVEPVAIPRPRIRTDRPVSSAPETHPLYSSSSSSSRIGDRLSGWFHHTFSTSSTDLSALLAQQALGPAAATSTARPGKGPNALLMAAKHGKGHLDKAMRYLLDSDAVPDKSTDPIWLLGVHHPGYEPQVVLPPAPTPEKKRRSSASPPVSFRSSTSSSNFPDSPLSQSTSSLAVSSSKSSSTPNSKLDPSANWPPAFYLDFTSRVWLTYRSQFSIPIRDIRLGDLSMSDNSWEGVACPPGLGSSTSKRSWPWGGGDKTWNSDSGWGCMLRTGQSLLANALVHTHLGRDWRRPPCPIHTADYATYVQILTWFFDTPSPEAPFSVHRMALAGKELGTDVGQWFGPSVAAGGIRTLVSQFPECGLAVAVATDSTLYQSQVFTASHGDSSTTNYRSPRRHYMRTWGDRPVLLLLGIRLGIEGVNPIYYDTIKRLYEFPQSVGIAGGRPGSSYYFVGSQGDNLFYLDPHHARPAIPLRSPPSAAVVAAHHERERTTVDDDEEDVEGEQKRHPTRSASSGHQFTPTKKKEKKGYYSHSRAATSTSTTSTTTTTSTSRSTSSSVSSHHHHNNNMLLSTPPPPPHAPLAPSPLQQQFSSSSADSSSVSYSTASTGDSRSSMQYNNHYHHQPSMRRRSPPIVPPPSYSPGGGGGGRGSSSQGHGGASRWRSASASAGQGGQSPPPPPPPRLSSAYSDSADATNRVVGVVVASDLDVVQQHYCTAYRMEELKTFHCERVRKMPLGGLDPSMLIGFLCRDEEDWWDFRRRVGELPRTIFSVQDEPPTWPTDSDDNMGLESMSEPDELDLEDGGEDDDDGDGVEVEVEMDAENEDDDEEEEEPFFDTQSAQSSLGRNDNNKSEEASVGTSEDDPVGPITPGPGSKYEFVERPRGGEESGTAKEGDGGEGDGDDIEDDDDWADPLVLDSNSNSNGGEKDELRLSRRRLGGGGGSKSRPPASSSIPIPISTTTRVNNKRKERPVPVPGVVIPKTKTKTKKKQHQQHRQEHYPFPVTPCEEGVLALDEGEGGGDGEGLVVVVGDVVEDEDVDVGGRNRNRQSSAMRVDDTRQVQMQKQTQQQQQMGYRMHSARARDGGRTQSGGVKGVLVVDSNNNNAEQTST